MENFKPSLGALDLLLTVNKYVQTKTLDKLIETQSNSQKKTTLECLKILTSEETLKNKKGILDKKEYIQSVIHLLNAHLENSAAIVGQQTLITTTTTQQTQHNNNNNNIANSLQNNIENTKTPTKLNTIEKEIFDHITITCKYQPAIDHIAFKRILIKYTEDEILKAINSLSENKLASAIDLEMLKFTAKDYFERKPKISQAFEAFARGTMPTINYILEKQYQNIGSKRIDYCETDSWKEELRAQGQNVEANIFERLVGDVITHIESERCRYRKNPGNFTRTDFRPSQLRMQVGLLQACRVQDRESLELLKESSFLGAQFNVLANKILNRSDISEESRHVLIEVMNSQR